jgi:hypothetical protein
VADTGSNYLAVNISGRGVDRALFDEPISEGHNQAKNRGQDHGGEGTDEQMLSLGQRLPRRDFKIAQGVSVADTQQPVSQDVEANDRQSENADDL